MGNRLAYLCASISLLAACGDDGGGTGDDTPDIDASGDPTIDGAPMPDGPPGAYSCIGDSHPTTAPGTINVSGVSESISTDGTAPLPGATVTARNSADQLLDSATAADTTGEYALQIDTGGTPLSGYLLGELEGYKDTYVYAPAPLATDLANIPVLMVDASVVWPFLPIIAMAPQSAQNGFVGILVVDCTGTPVAGATVTVSGAAAANVRYPQGTTVPTNSDGATDTSGLALVFNVPPGNTIMVDASTPDHEFEAHAIVVRADVITSTVVAPGPISGLAP
jgi:hypothetical protein